MSPYAIWDSPWSLSMQYEEHLERLNADIQADVRALRISNQVGCSSHAPNMAVII